MLIKFYLSKFSNPLNTFIGNADLKPNENYSFYTNFNNYDYASKSGFMHTQEEITMLIKL